MSIKNLYTNKEKEYQNLNIYAINSNSKIENRITTDLIYRYGGLNIQTISDGITFNIENNILITKLEPFDFITILQYENYFDTNINIPSNINIVDSGYCGTFQYEKVDINELDFGFVEFHKPSNQFRFFKTNLIDWDPDTHYRMTNPVYLKLISTQSP